MTSRRLEDLRAPMQRKAEIFLRECERIGLEVLIYCTLRTAEEQARLYRQGRNIRTIRGKAQELRKYNFALADLLLNVGPQHGSKVTMAGPGQSLHQYGWAFDGTIMRHGKPVWDINDEGWQGYAHCAEIAKLEWAGKWRFSEYPHCQMSGKNWRKLIRGLK